MFGIKKILYLYFGSFFCVSLSFAEIAQAPKNADYCIPAKQYIYFKEGSDIPVGRAFEILKYVSETSVKQYSYILLEGSFDKNEKPYDKSLSSKRLNKVIYILRKQGVPENYIWSRDNFDKSTNTGSERDFAGKSPEARVVTAYMPDEYRFCRKKEKKDAGDYLKKYCTKKEYNSSCDSAIEDLVQ